MPVVSDKFIMYVKFGMRTENASFSMRDDRLATDEVL